MRQPLPLNVPARLSGTYTATPQQIADFLTTHGLIGTARLNSALYSEALARPHPSVQFISPAMGPDDELSPFARILQSGVGTVGEDTAPPVRFLSSRQRNPLGDGMSGWRYSVDPTGPQYVAQSSPSPRQPGGLLGLLLDHLRDNSNI